jgi:acetoin utilization deacetylase AcuC-like enzyme
VLVVSSPEHLRHDPAREVMNGRSIGIYEVPARVESIQTALAADGRFEARSPQPHGMAPIEAVHDAGLVAHLAEAWSRAVSETEGLTEVMPDTFLHPGLREGMEPAEPPEGAIPSLGAWVFDTATPLVEGTYAAARAAVDVALTGLELVLGGERSVYALCRPPGHHAARRVYGGYCYFNNAAIAAQAARGSGASRVAILDVDYHHGNGTQQIFYDRGDVFYASLHADPQRAYPYYTGAATETGAGSGKGGNLNLPLAEAIDDEAYLAALDQAIAAVDTFDPGVVVVSLGLDTYRLDPIADFTITTEGYTAHGRRIADLDRPTLVVQEGGYHVPDLGTNVRAFLLGLLRLP